MSTIAAPGLLETMQLEAPLLEAIVSSVQNALPMCGVEARCVGLSRVPAKESGAITGMIGVHGSVSGFVAVNLPERFALAAVGGLLGEHYDALSSQVIDGVGELTNMITGGIKSAVTKTDWSFSHITVPSVIVGQGYAIAYARGLQFMQVTFEHDDAEAVLLSDRLLSVTVSLLKR